MKIAVHTLGCKVNQCDADSLIAGLAARGHAAFAYRGFDADVIVINTCTVTHAADKKSRQLLRRAKRENPCAFVAMCGCGTKDENPNADFVFDAREPEDFFAKIDSLASAFETDNFATRINAPKGLKTRAFIKIQDGCDRFCSYCIVPYVRGTPTSRPMQEIIAEAERLIAAGALEIVLTGIQSASYEDANGTFPDLIKKVASLGVNRLRLSSIDPTAADEKFLQAVAESHALCGHFHLSLQSGCDTTLKKMNRRYTSDEYKKAVLALRQIRPDAALTTDVIVGFPGESDSDFLQSLMFVRQMEFAQIHVFEFSPRKGTPAADFPGQVHPKIKAERGKAMRTAAEELQRKFLQKQVGTTLSVLFETANEGHAKNYCSVQAKNATPNTIENVKILSCSEQTLKGEIIYGNAKN